MTELVLDGQSVKITNPEKVFWPDLGIRKIDYIKWLIQMGPYILPHAKNRLLTVIRFPDGIEGKSFFQKNTPNYAPNWVKKAEWNGNMYTLLNSMAALVWLGNQAALEFHTSFNLSDLEDNPTCLVFDLDPSEGQEFQDVVEVALLINETLEELKINSYVKTSGATGLQIYIPVGQRYDYTAARKINEFFGRFFAQKYPDRITLERIVKKRGNKLYFDYLQMWNGKTITMVYSPRTTKMGTVSMPVTWDELRRGIQVNDFNILNALERIKDKGDIFTPLLSIENAQNLNFILNHIKA